MDSKHILLGWIAFFAFLFYLGSTPASAAPTAQDSLYLHYDCAPDRDDLQAMVAGSQIVNKVGITPKVVIGTHSYQSRPGNLAYYRAECNELSASFDDVRDVGYNFTGHAAAVAAEWDATIRNGGTVYVAEGGPSDFTFQVLINMVENQKKVEIVQHSSWNEQKTHERALPFVKSMTSYTKIEDGNGANRTPDYNVGANASLTNQLAATHPQWRKAITYHPRDIIDFSDTVELTHILGLNLPTVSSFINYVKGTVTPPPTTTTGTSFILDLANGQSDAVGSGDKTWVRRTELGQTGYQLLPDTRVTPRDRLIAGTNFWDSANANTPYIEYFFEVEEPGTYEIEVQALSRGIEDNGAHIYINGSWVIERLQWCAGKNSWTYSSAVRTGSNHCGTQGTAKVTLRRGTNVLRIGAREDGLFVSKVRFGGTTTTVTTTNNTTNTNSSGYAAFGNNLVNAKQAYARGTTLPRRDCDPVVGGYVCASFSNPSLSDVTTTPTEPEATTVQLCLAQVCRQISTELAEQIEDLL